VIVFVPMLRFNNTQHRCRWRHDATCRQSDLAFERARAPHDHALCVGERPALKVIAPAESSERNSIDEISRIRAHPAPVVMGLGLIIVSWIESRAVCRFQNAMILDPDLQAAAWAATCGPGRSSDRRWQWCLGSQSGAERDDKT
jgi:hypothetical protein